MSESGSPQKSPTLEQNEELGFSKVSPSKQPNSPHLKNKTGLVDFAGKSTFMTGTGMVGAKKQGEDSKKIEEINGYHYKLNELVEQLDTKVRTLLNENQTNFLMAYKEQMMHIQKELKALKKKIDEETYKRKNDERMNILEQERDWFRAEAIRLDKVCKEQQRTLQELKFKLKLVNEDKNYFEEFVLIAKKENKALKEELMQFEMGRKSVENLGSTGNSNRKTVPKRDLSSRRGDQRKGSRDTDGEEEATVQVKEFQIQGVTNEEKLLDVIKQMKTELDKERKTTRQLRQEKSQLMIKRIELEEILVDSINEVKKEIAKRRTVKFSKEANKMPQIPQDIDISKFSATDKRNLLEYFMSNEFVLEELYTLVFSGSNPSNAVHTPPQGDRSFAPTNVQTSKSDSKLKYSFNYGFGNTHLLRMGPKEINNAAISQKAQSLIGELRRPDAKRPDGSKKDL